MRTAGAAEDLFLLPSMSNALYPSPSEAALRHLYVGNHLTEVNAPAAILDRAVVKRNCSQMLNACRSLGVAFRAHVKTHKVQGANTSMLFSESSHPLQVMESSSYCFLSNYKRLEFLLLAPPP